MDLGCEDYLSTVRLQEELLGLRQQGAIPDTFLVVEHRPCVTIGRGGTYAHILADKDALDEVGIKVHVSDRGGDVTYHGPGQLVLYPIIDLGNYARDVHAHARRLEAVMMQTAASFGVASWRMVGFPGVWTALGKIGAIGVAVRRWVTIHGAALNVCPDLRAFSLIVPCGLHGARITSLEEIQGCTVDLGEARTAMRDACEQVYCCSLAEVARRDLVSTPTRVMGC